MSEFDYTTNSNDSLVFKLTETITDDESKSDIDNIIYMFFDPYENRYHLRGKRYDTLMTNLESPPYSFCCESKHDLFNFIDFIIPSRNKVLYELITYQDMPILSSNITYDYLESYYSSQNEIVAFHPKKLKEKSVVKVLRILRNIYNDY